MTDTLGIAAAMAGVVLFIPKFWDVVFDPMVGVASDRTHSR
ncbi:MFS transporter [Roseateles toxinivorans]|uniref:MFS transporter n=1 Tax=Roseateles toxinivorans TaxID=270368 RepID=A0A4R6QDG3_9BURK|nr:MFS transporter [Roseateles toxinivorans]